jgi:ABC-type multidrug transport system fused ATPase/permease subunit
MRRSAWLVDHLKGYWWSLLAISVTSLASVELRVYVPVLIGRAVNSLVTPEKGALLEDTTLIVVVSLVSSVLQFFTTYGGQWLAQRVVYDIRKELFDSIEHKKLEYYDRSSTGDLMTRCTMDVEAIRRLVGFAGPQFVTNLFLIVVAGYSLFALGAVYGYIFLATIPFLVALTVLFGFKQESHWKKIREKYGKMTRTLQQNIVGHRTVRAYAAEEGQIEQFRRETSDYLESYREVSLLRGVYNPLLSLTVSLAAGSLLIFAGHEVIAGNLALGSLVASVNIFALLLNPVRFLGQFVIFYENGIAGSERILEVMFEPSENLSDGSLSAEKITGEIQFDHVGLIKKGGKILEDINLHIRSGEVVGVVGVTGSGKSTLVNLIPRFYEPTSGKILVDGHELHEYILASLRKAIGFVSQDPFLFSGTIAENIAFGASEPRPEEIAEAARLAQLSSFIERLPEGYQTRVGERGITLSGGQRQRVAIARALLANPRILILDEPVSSLDANTEKELIVALKRVISGRTAIVVSHRLSILRLTSRIIVLSKGRVVEEGSLDELLKEGKEFRRVLFSEIQLATAGGKVGLA